MLDRSAAKSFNGSSRSVQPVSVGEYGSTISDLFISHLWTAQVIALWVTDGQMYSDYEGMRNIVSRNGHNPSDLSPLNIVNGVATTDLRDLLNGGNTSAAFVKGPDGMFGPSAESLIEEFAGTGRIFGTSLPTSANDGAYASLIGLAMNVNTPKIKAARDKFEAGSPPASREEPVRTPCNQLTPTARAARADCPSGNSGGGGGGGGKDRQKPPGPPATAANLGETDWVLYGGIAAGIAILAGTGYYLYSQRSSAAS